MISRYSLAEREGEGSRALLLDWVNAALPNREITDFTTCWSNGVNLLSLVNFCRPGLVPDLDSINPDSALDNVKQAMQLAKDSFFIPQVMSPEEMAVDRPDERSVMTYLSYFSGAKSSAQKTLFLWIKQQLPDGVEVANFGKDWVSGRVLGALVHSLSSSGFIAYEQFEEGNNAQNCQAAMDAADSLLGIKKTLTADEFADPHLNLLKRTAYLLQLYHSTLKVTILDVHYPDAPGPNQTMWVDLKFNGGSISMIKSLAKGATVGAVETASEELEEGKYRVSFETEHPDEYSLSMTVGGVRVPNSPFVCSLTPPDVGAVAHTNTVLPKKVGIPVILSFDVSHAGTGELTAEVVGSVSGTIPASIDVSFPTNQKVSFIPMQSEAFTVTIRFNGEEVAGSPFELPLDKLSYPELVQLSQPVVEKPGLPVITVIDLSKAGEGKLEAECISDKTGEIAVTISEEDSGTEIAFTPPVEDIYYLTVKFNGTEVAGSPLKIDLYPEPPDAKKVRLSVPPSGALHSGVPITVGFNAAEAGEGEMTAHCVGKNHGDIPIEVKQTGKFEYEVTFLPPDEDVYSIDVLWSEQPIKGSPFKVDLFDQDRPEPSNCQIVNMPRDTDIILTEEIVKFQVNTVGAGRGALSVTVDIVKNEVSSDVATSEQPKEAVKPEEVETLKEIEQTEHPEHPEQTEETEHPEQTTEQPKDTQGPEEAEKPDQTEEPKEAEKPDQTEELKEAEKPDQTEELKEAEKPEEAAAMKSGDNHEDSNLAPSVNSKKSEDEQLPVPLVTRSDDDLSVYSVSYTPLKASQYTVSVLWDGEHVPHSPFTFSVIAPPVATIGNPIAVNLKTVYKRKHLKAYGISRSGGPQLKVKMEKIASGDYRLVFKPSEPGVYLLHVSTKEKTIPGSPFIVRYVDTGNPAAIKVSGLKEEAVVGQPMEFVIDAKDAGLGDVTVAPLGSVYSLDSTFTHEGDITSVYLKDNKDGTYSAVFTPEAPGDTNLDIRFGGEVVPGSPFQVTVLQKTEEKASAATTDKKKDKKAKKSKSSSLISGLNLEEEKFLVGTAHKFKIHCEDLGEGELEVTTKPHSAADIEVTHVAGENSYWVEITPKKPGKNDILVKFNGSHILGSPFRVQFQSRGDAAKCMLIDTPKECQRELDQKVSFCISTKGSGKGKVTASVKSISTKSEVPSDVERVSKHHYHVIFSPIEGLNYLMSVRFDEVHINGSPYKIALGDASLCRVEGEGLEQAWCGRWNTFRINVEDAGPGELVVHIEGDDPEEEVEGMRMEQNISKVDDNNYEVSYQPFFPGKYWVTVKWGNINIPGSPFDVTCKKPLSPEQFSVEPVSLTHQGKPAHLLVTCDSVIEESDKLSISVHTQQDEKILGEVTKKEENCSYVATIRPPELQDYLVYVLWDEKHVTGSPFEITNIPAPSSGDFPVEAMDSGEGVIAMRVTGPPYSFRYGTLSAAVSTAAGESVDFPITISKLSDEESSIEFQPAHGGLYKLGIEYDYTHIAGSPFQLVSTDASQCYARGLGISSAKVDSWNKFSVFTENGGPGELRVEVEGEVEGEGDVILNALVTAASDTRYDVSYYPTLPGPYKVSVFWDIQQIPDSPFNVFCCDPKRYTIPKCPTEGSLGRPIRVGVKELSKPLDNEKLEIYASTKDHIKHLGEVGRGADRGVVAMVTPPKVGKYMIHVQCNGFEIDQSPFKVKNYPPPKPEKVVADGPGLSDGSVGEKGSFVVNVAEGGHGYLSLKVQGPKGGFKINLQRDPEDEDRIFAEYNPTHRGLYKVSLLWAGDHIANSPFNVTIGEARPPTVNMSQLQETQ